ncbi:MAG: hypothetical protein M3N14_10275, partial [Bacteroidota bacterium]|nr:hypothetical protein [Bacteroidota bacterium]
MKNQIPKIYLVIFFPALFLLLFSISQSFANIKIAHSTVLCPDSSVKVKGTTDSIDMGQYKNKSYVLQQDLRVIECNAVGEKITNPTGPIAPQGMTFTVKGITRNGDLVISFWIWSLKKNSQENSGVVALAGATFGHTDPVTTAKVEKQQFEQRDRVLKRETFNFKQYGYKSYAPASIDSVNDNRRYFLLGKESLKKSCIEYHEVKKWDINFGTLVTPFKLRFRRFEFANNLSVGGAIYYQRKFDMDWSWGGVFALSLSSVTLDPASTNIHQNASNTNPPLTESTT